MALFIKKPVITQIEALTFDELVEYGRKNGANIVNGMPWSFEYKGWPVSHESDKCYIIGSFHLTPDDMLVTDEVNSTFVLSLKSFNTAYVKVKDVSY